MRMIAALLCLCAAWPALAQAKLAPDGAGPAETGLFRGHEVSFHRAGGRAIYQGDILLDHVTAGPVSGHVVPNAVGIAYAQYFWPATGGIAQIPYVVTSAPSTLTTAINQFNATFTGIIQFTPRGSETDYVDFDFDPNNLSGVCESFVGRVGGAQQVTGAYNCALGTLLHEMGHVVGLFHEQSRTDRDSFVTVEYGNIIKGSRDNFDILTDDFQNLGPYDYASVMHYIPYAFTRNGGPTIESIPPGMMLSNTSGYTAADIDAVKRLYGAAPKTVTVTSSPPGLVVSVDGTNVTTPQTYSWALNSTHSLAVASAGQSLGGAAYVYGRWNDNTAASHSITVKPGNHTLAQPKTSPAVTVYTANFVALAPYTAVTAPAGKGSISAAPTPLTYAGLSGSYFVARQQVTLTPSANAGYAFLTWGGTDAPWSANPKPTRVPDLGAALAVTAYLSTKPITTITTTPPGLGFQVDGNYYYGPQNFASDVFSGWTPGSTHTLSSWSPQYPYSINSRFAFNSWSDGGALTHSITLPSGASSITGDFTPQFVPIGYAQPSCAATVALSPSSPDGFYDTGTPVTFKSTQSAGWLLTGWLYDLSGRANPQTLSVTDEELAVANYSTSRTPLSITTLKPATLTAGGTGGTIAIKGNGYTSSSIVFVNNIYRASTYVSAKEIDVALTASDVATAGAFPIAVSNFPAGAPCAAYLAHTFFVTTK